MNYWAALNVEGGFFSFGVSVKTKKRQVYQNHGTTHHLITKTQYIICKKDANCILVGKGYKKAREHSLEQNEFYNLITKTYTVQI